PFTPAPSSTMARVIMSWLVRYVPALTCTTSPGLCAALMHACSVVLHGAAPGYVNVALGASGSASADGPARANSAAPSAHRATKVDRLMRKRPTRFMTAS